MHACHRYTGQKIFSSAYICPSSGKVRHITHTVGEKHEVCAEKAQWENLKRLPSATVYGLGREKTVAGFVYAAALYISRTSDTEKTKKSDENPKKMQNYTLHP